MLSSQTLRRVTVAALAATAVLTAVNAPGARAATTGDLYVATTDGGTLTPATGKDQYTLTLAQPGAKVTAFADRPARTAGEESLRSFIKQWPQNGFAKVPPNAALVVDGADTGHDVMVLELSHPKLTSKGALTLDAKRVDGKPSSALKSFSKRADQSVARKFGRASLFVDASATTTSYPVQVSISATGGQFVRIGMDSATVNLQEGTSSWQVSGPSQSVTNYDNLMVIGPTTGYTATYQGMLDVTGDTITGTAQLPAGVTATVKIGNNAAVAIANGAYSVPLG